MRSPKTLISTEYGWGLASLAVILAVGAGSVWWVANAEDHQMRRALVDEATLAAKAIGMDRLKGLTGSAADINSPDYRQIKEQLASMRSGEPRCRLLYVLGRRPDGTVFLLADSEPANSRDYSPPGEVYADASGELLSIFGTGAGAIEGPARAKWGVRISGFVPLRDHETGRVEAVFGMDVDWRAWSGQIAANCAVSVSTTFLFAALVGVLLIVRYRGEHRLADEKLKELQLCLESTLSTTGAGLAVIDADLNVRHADNGGQGICGPNEGPKCYEHFLGADAPCQDCRVAKALATRAPAVSEQHLPREDRYVQITAIPFRERTGEWLVLHVTVDISDRRRAEEALRDSALRHQLILDSVGDGIVGLDIEGRVTFANPAALSMLGHRREEMVGKVGHSVFHCKKTDGSPHPAGDCSILASIRDGAVRKSDLEVFWKQDGTSFPIEFTSAPVRTDGGIVGAVIVFRDLTERRRAEETRARSEKDLRESRQQFMDMIAVLPDATLIIDRNGRVIAWNKAMEEMTGVTAGEMLGKGDYEYSLPFYGERRPILVDVAMRADPEREKSYTVIKREGDALFAEAFVPNLRPGNRYLSATASVLRDSAGEVIAAIECIRDTTERKRSLERQEQINRLQQALLAPGDLARKLKMIADGVVGTFSADFCRIWVCGRGDLCEQGCMHAAVTEGPHVCAQRDRCLRLVASSGRYTHTDGRVHRRVPFDCYKIGLVASGKEHRFLTNDAAHDPRVHDHEWVKELGLVSFAGYQLRPAGGETLGVLALFSKQPIFPEEDAQLDSLSNTAARVIVAARGEEMLQDSEERYRVLFESSRDAMMTIAPPSWQFTACNPACVEVFGLRSVDELLSRGPWDVSPERQPDGAPSAQMARERIEAAMRDGSSFFEWTHKRLDGDTFSATVLLTRCSVKGQVLVQATVRDITRQKQTERELQKAHDETRSLLESLSSLLIGVDAAGRVTAWNRVAARFLGIESSDAVGRALDDLGIPWDREPIWRGVAQCRSTGAPARIDDVKCTRRDGTAGFLGVTVNQIMTDQAPDGSFLLVAQDITERRILEWQLYQAQRLESVGRLAAGIAHEINTPTQFVSDNIRFLETSFQVLKGVLAEHEHLVEAARTGSMMPKEIEQAQAVSKAARLDYLLEQIPEAISDSLEGLERVTKLVLAMKDFSHPGMQQALWTDINKSIESTVTVSRNEWKYIADMVLNLDPSLPSVLCFPADFNQVILNIILNASQAIADAPKAAKQAKGTITVTTLVRDGCVEVRIADTGTGIPEEHRDKIFDPFFTTKEVGKGAGQGLAIARTVIVNKHCGALTFETEMGKGTTFIIRLPLNIEPKVEEAGAK